MPLYEYRCKKCKLSFEAYYSLSDSAGQKSSACPKCQDAAMRVFTPIFFARENSGYSDLADDPPEYREMHYYEKKKDWRRAAEAAEGVSDFAKNKFLQEAKEEGQ